MLEELVERAAMSTQESVISYSRLYSRSYSYSLPFFLEQLDELPPFHKLEGLEQKLGRDCSKWVELYQNETTSLVQSTRHISQEDYLATFRQLNPTKELEVIGAFAGRFEGLLKTAQANSFVDNPYHRILFELLFT